MEPHFVHIKNKATRHKARAGRFTVIVFDAICVCLLAMAWYLMVIYSHHFCAFSYTITTQEFSAHLYGGRGVAYFSASFHFFFSPVSTIKYRIITFFLHPPHRPHGSPQLVCERACVPLRFRNVEKNGGNHQTRATQICAAAIFTNELSSLAIC